MIRGSDGVLRAFANFCRHRGSTLAEGQGNASRLVCPYHAWSYFADGCLYGCPDMEDSEGFVFLTYHPDTPPLLDHLGDLPDRMVSHRVAEMRTTWSVTIEAMRNWKLLLENAMEAYHTGTVHRESLVAQVSRTLPTKGNWLCIQVLSDRCIATLPDQAPPFSPITGLDDDARLGTYFTAVLPSSQFALAQDCLWWLNVLPLAHSRSRLEIGGCFPEAALADPDFNAKATPYCDRWEMVGREDVAILERQQQALSSVLYRPGPLSHRDDMVQALGLWVLDQLGE